MKIFTIIFLIIIITIKINANPLVVPYPTIISEIYFDSNGNWYIEFNTNNMQLYSNLNNFDNITIESSTDTANFKLGINLTDSIVIITQDSLTSQLLINPYGDFIKISGIISDYQSEYYFPFGNYEYSYVKPINNSFSYQMTNEHPYYFAIQTIPTIGFLNNNLPTGIFTGHIIDADSIPIPNVEIILDITSYNYETHQILDIGNYDDGLVFSHLIQADINGNFNSLYGRQNYILHFYDNDYYYDTTITIDIEQENINDFIFKLDCNKIPTSIENVEIPNCKTMVYPNPTSEKINISFKLKNITSVNNAVIKIYSAKSDLLKIVPVSTLNISEEQNISIDLSMYPEGNYYYNIEINGKKISSNKIIIVR